MTRDEKEELRKQDKEATLDMLRHHALVLELRAKLIDMEHEERYLEKLWTKARVAYMEVEDEKT